MDVSRGKAGKQKVVFFALPRTCLSGPQYGTIPGLPMRGDFYEYDDWDLGKVKGMPEVFGVGNVVTGQGNIAISRKHAQKVSDVVLQEYLGLGEKPLD